MKSIFKPAIAAGIALAAILGASPAAAQVNGIATNNPTIVLVESASRDTAFQQINQTYASNIQLIGTLDQEINQLQVQLDADGDRNITQVEFDANPALVQQIQAKNQQLALASQPIELAHLYVLEQLINDYTNARDQVIAEKGISIILAPDAVMYSSGPMDISSDVAAALDARQPTLGITPPAGWQPQQTTVQSYESVQQIMLLVYQQAAARAAAAQQAGQTVEGAPPVAVPATPAGPPAEGR
jgi:Skp family chaperone for outer membrane proteins